MFLLLSLLWDLFSPLLGTYTFTPKYPLERNVRDPKLFRPRHDPPRDVRRKFLSMGPFLYSCLSYTSAQRSGKLSIAQRDAFPWTEYVEENSQPVR